MLAPGADEGADTEGGCDGTKGASNHGEGRRRKPPSTVGKSAKAQVILPGRDDRPGLEMGLVILEASLPGQVALSSLGMMVNALVQPCVVHAKRRRRGWR